MPLIAALIASFGPMLKDLFFKILVALGVSFVSYKGIEYTFNQLLGYMSANYFELPPQALQLLGIAGVGEAVNIVVGAALFVLSMKTTSKVFSFVGSKK